jgi:hypothetical protein
VQPATELVVLFAPPPQERRRHQLTDRARAPRRDRTQFIIPNGPWSSRPADPHDAGARRPIEGLLPRDGSAVWLRNAAVGLCALSAAAAAVSFTAQYRMVYADRRLAVVAGLEAAIPDAAALVFACLGIALALHGRRAIRARALNVASVGASVFMNVIAAAPGWRSLAVWAMPPTAYALASDTLIGVSLWLVILIVLISAGQKVFCGSAWCATGVGDRCFAGRARAGSALAGRPAPEAGAGACPGRRGRGDWPGCQRLAVGFSSGG